MAQRLPAQSPETYLDYCVFEGLIERMKKRIEDINTKRALGQDFQEELRRFYTIRAMLGDILTTDEVHSENKTSLRHVLTSELSYESGQRCFDVISSLNSLVALADHANKEKRVPPPSLPLVRSET